MIYTQFFFFSHTSVRIRTPAEGVNFRANSHTRADFVKFSHTTDLTEYSTGANTFINKKAIYDSFTPTRESCAFVI